MPMTGLTEGEEQAGSLKVCKTHTTSAGLEGCEELGNKTGSKGPSKKRGKTGKLEK